MELGMPAPAALCPPPFKSSGMVELGMPRLLPSLRTRKSDGMMELGMPRATLCTLTLR